MIMEMEIWTVSFHVFNVKQETVILQSALNLLDGSLVP